MKKSIIIVLLAGFIFPACKKETKDVSKIETVGHPKIILTGDPAIAVPPGSGTYVDPGAVGIDDIKGTTVPLSPVFNNVDLANTGFYSVTYSFQNTNGDFTYNTSVSRLVLVTPVPDSVDVSGDYQRTSNGQVVTLTRITTALYSIDNVGGVANNPNYLFPIFIGQTSDTTLNIPPQPNPLGGDVYCSNAKITISGANVSFSYVVHGSGFGTSVRSFVKL
jgi:hypothetical protein